MSDDDRMSQKKIGLGYWSAAHSVPFVVVAVVIFFLCFFRPSSSASRRL